MSEYDREAWIKRGFGSLGVVAPWGKNVKLTNLHYSPRGNFSLAVLKDFLMFIADISWGGGGGGIGD